jgi:GDPmannose 4,6-dehydratase/GDP-4-dehydro-6-deoxy-D-mannose reductase
MQQKAIEVQAPNEVTIDQDYLNIFLAGSIEMGKAIDWQTDMSEFFSKNNWGVFNPRRKDLFASAFARQVVKIERGEQSVLKHGNLDSVRTLMDVRDMAEAYWVASYMCDSSTPYNIGGTDIMTVGEFLQRLIKHAKVPIICELDKTLLRPKDVTNQVCDTSKFRLKTTWKPQYNFDESLEFLLDYYRKEK